MNVVDQNGFLQRRSRFMPDGREVIIIDNRRRGPSAGAIAAGIGIGFGIGALIVSMPPPIVYIPRERYIVDYGMAPPAYVYDALIAPPDRSDRASLFARRDPLQRAAARPHAACRSEHRHIRNRRVGAHA